MARGLKASVQGEEDTITSYACKFECSICNESFPKDCAFMAHKKSPVQKVRNFCVIERIARPINDVFEHCVEPSVPYAEFGLLWLKRSVNASVLPTLMKTPDPRARQAQHP